MLSNAGAICCITKFSVAVLEAVILNTEITGATLGDICQGNDYGVGETTSPLLTVLPVDWQVASVE